MAFWLQLIASFDTAGHCHNQLFRQQAASLTTRTCQLCIWHCLGSQRHVGCMHLQAGAQGKVLLSVVVWQESGLLLLVKAGPSCGVMPACVYGGARSVPQLPDCMPCVVCITVALLQGAGYLAVLLSDRTTGTAVVALLLQCECARVWALCRGSAEWQILGR